MRNVSSTTFGNFGSEVIQLTDAKNYLRIDDTSDDTLVTALITASRSAAEKYLNRLVVQTTCTTTVDSFPACGIRLPYGPVQSVTSIQVTDSSGNQTVWAASNYLVDTAGERIVYSETATFPTSYAQINAIQVTYVAGFGSQDGTTGVPGGVIQGMRHLIAAMYENREINTAVPPLVGALLDPFKKYVI